MEMTMDTYEKKYKEALNKAKKELDTCGSQDCDAARQIFRLFPELAESEDEKVRKWCISHFKECINVIKDNDEYKEYLSNKVLSWLEKQGEQKSSTEVKPKFNVGDLVIDNCGYVWKIEGIINQFYILEGVEGGESRSTIEWVNKTFHLWTIQDAKDGDVLFVKPTKNLGEQLIIFGEIDSCSRIKYYCRFLNNKFSINDGLMGYDHKYFLPATKEQRDLLFSKIKEAGYEWDAENKQLNKIHIVHDIYCQDNCKGFQETGKCFADGDCEAKREAEQKPIDVRTTGYWHVEDVEQKPTDEEMKRLLQTEYEKGRAGAIAEMQKEWGEEDIIHLNNCISYMSRLDSSEMDWLKFLKSKVVNSKK